MLPGYMDGKGNCISLTLTQINLSSFIYGEFSCLRRPLKSNRNLYKCLDCGTSENKRLGNHNFWNKESSRCSLLILTQNILSPLPTHECIYLHIFMVIFLRLGWSLTTKRNLYTCMDGKTLKQSVWGVITSVKENQVYATYLNLYITFTILIMHTNTSIFTYF